MYIDMARMEYRFTVLFEHHSGDPELQRCITVVAYDPYHAVRKAMNRAFPTLDLTLVGVPGEAHKSDLLDGERPTGYRIDHSRVRESKRPLENVDL